MIFERAAPVGLVELRAKGFVLEHDVENIAQHFVRDDVRLRNDCGGSGIEIHARHFAKKIARTEFSDGVAVRKIDRGINGNGPIPGFFFPLVVFARDERAGQPLE